MSDEEEVVTKDQRSTINNLAAKFRDMAPKSEQGVVLNTLINQTNAEKEPKTHFLALPPELRTRIYEYVLLEKDPIKLSTTGPRPPGPLSVSVSFRSESIGMYYTQNAFELVVTDYNAKANLPAYERHLKYCGFQTDSGSHQRQTGLMSIRLQGAPNWQNLKEWCEAVYNGELPRPTAGSHEATEIAAVVAILQAVAQQRLGGASWEVVVASLAGFRKLMILQDAAWAA